MKVREKETKKATEKEKKQDGFQVTLEYIKSFLIALLLALLIKATVIEAYKIPTPSMEKTLLAGDFILGNKFIYGIKIPFTDIRLPAFREPQRGDIVIFRPPHSPNENYVKRLIGMPGDTLKITRKRVYINGELYDDTAFTQNTSDYMIPRDNVVGQDPYIDAQRRYGVTNDGHRTWRPFRDNSYPIVVPEGKYFMMGDNRDNSLDSRMWGFVDREQILGQALIIHWSWDIHDKDAPHVNWKNPITVVQNVFYNLIHFPERVLWERLGRVPQ
ncbi:MAG: signal peptidase I [candidate division Zixibacteria bacterium]|jgi:signal peptidase I|nr:signal peptidase I [candidate division Zixibacteria bacterium]